MKTKIIQKLGSKSPITSLRLKNINWIIGLNRNELQYGKNEVTLNFHKTEAGEIVGIRYPGKESDSSRKNVYEYDFRPKVRLKNGEYLPDLTFFQIWDALYKNIPQTDEGRALLGVIFYRMAYMIDYLEHLPVEHEAPDKQVCEELPSGGYLGINYASFKTFLGKSAVRGDWAGMSLEAFLYYNDLLALNEDVKYWFRSENLKKEKWKADGVGRVNTMLTHLNVIGYHSGKINFAALIERFSRGKGVCPVDKKEAVLICEPFLFL